MKRPWASRLAWGLAVALVVGCGASPVPVGDDTLRIDVVGLSSGAEADIVVSGPEGFIQRLKGSAVLTDLAPGDYAVSAVTVSSDDAVFETLMSETVTLAVPTAEGAALTVAYACTEVLFADPEVESYVRMQLAQPAGEIDCQTLATLESLFADDVTDASGLQHATGLVTLSLFGEMDVVDDEPRFTGLDDISPIARLTRLEELHLAMHPFDDLGRLTGHPNLAKLTVQGSNVTDIAPVATLANLAELNVSLSKVSDIGPLDGFDQLTSLALIGNAIRDIAPLRTLSRLETLWLSHNPVTGLGPIAGLSNVWYLGLNRASVDDDDLNAVRFLTALRGLELDGNQISDLDPLRSLTSLTYLRLGNNRIRDITPLANLSVLGSLFLNGNGLSDIETVRNLPSLRLLALSDNAIADLSPIVENPGIAGEDDRVHLGCNVLDVSGGDDLVAIQTLQARGVRVTYEPQKPDAACAS